MQNLFTHKFTHKITNKISEKFNNSQAAVIAKAMTENFRESWNEKIFPAVNDFVSTNFINHKRKILSEASGDILEIGFGSGLSLDAYPDAVTKIVGLEPSAGMLERWRTWADSHSSKMESKLEVLQGYAEELPFEDNSFDGVVSFFVLCSVSDLDKSIQEIKRVLKPNGKLYFIEHMGHEETSSARKLQDTLEPVWKNFACGCHLTRNTMEALMGQGFEMETTKLISYNGFPNVLSPLYRGIAILRKSE